MKTTAVQQLIHSTRPTIPNVRRSAIICTSRRLESSAHAGPAPSRFPNLAQPTAPPPALARLPTLQVARTILLGSVFTRPWLLRTSMGLMGKIAKSRSALWNPDKNPLLRAMVRLGIYDHFCAGIDSAEVGKTVAEIKKMGYAGVIVCPSREIVADENPGFACRSDAELVREWRDLHMETLAMLGKGDYLGLKYSGAGPGVFKDLAEGREEPSPELKEAIDALCKQAAAQGSLIWFDAEQQLIQSSIDRWTVELMRKYNVNGVPVVSNTYQAYLKDCSKKLESHLRLAQTEGWTLGMKLVRGAYISHEIRDRIHDTKTDTDNAYNSISTQIITRQFPGFEQQGPDVHIFCAGHNAESIHTAIAVYRDAIARGQRVSPARWGQLMGMADEVSCKVLQESEEINKRARSASPGQNAVIEVYKCLQWGSVGECMQYLLRRATENSGGAARMAESVQLAKKDLWRRLFGRQA